MKSLASSETLLPAIRKIIFSENGIVQLVINDGFENMSKKSKKQKNQSGGRKANESQQPNENKETKRFIKIKLFLTNVLIAFILFCVGNLLYNLSLNILYTSSRSIINIFSQSLSLPMVIPGILTGVSVSIPRSRGRMVWFGIATASVSLILFDFFMAWIIIGHNYADWPLNLQIILFNLGGGIVAGTLLGNISYRLARRWGKPMIPEISAIDTPTTIEKIGVAVVIFTTLFYFLFIEKLPNQVNLSLTDWERIGFQYVKAISKYTPLLDFIEEKIPVNKRGKPIVRVLLSTRSFHCKVKNKETRFYWCYVLDDHRPSVAPVKTSIKISSYEKNFTLEELISIYSGVYSKYLPLAENTLKKEIPEGDLSIQGGPLHLLLNSLDASLHQKKMFLILFVPIGKTVVFSKKLRDFNSFINLSPSSIIETLRERKAISIRIVDSDLSNLIIRQESGLGLWSCTPDFPFFENRPPAGGYNIVLPDNQPKINIKSPILNDPNFPYPLCFLQLGSLRTHLMVNFSSSKLNNFEFLDPDFKFESDSEVTVIANFSVTGPTGQIVVGKEKYSLTPNDNLQLMGNDLYIEDQDQGGVLVKGQTDKVLLNGISLSKTLWDSMSSEIKAALITILGSLLIGWITAKLRSRGKGV